MPLNRESLTPDALRPVLILLAVIWAVQVLNFVMGYWLNDWFGLAPRDLGGLIGVPLSPVLHAGWGHAISNSLPLLVLGGMAAMTAPKRFAMATFLIVVIGGLLVWVFARGGNRVHVGASGLVFGYFGFLVALGIVERSFVAILAAVAAVIFYGGLIWGVLPDARVSWESHLFGAIAGAITAYILRTDRGQTPHVT